MKILPLLAITILVLALADCNKNNETVTPINCEGLITDTLGTNDNAKVYMPNAFSPNSDGVNDMVRPITSNIVAIQFTVYDESNAVVFTTKTLGEGWQPTTPTTVSTKYYYRIQATTSTGRKIGNCGELYKLTCFPSGISKSSFYFEDQLTTSGFRGTTSEVLPNCP